MIGIERVGTDTSRKPAESSAPFGGTSGTNPWFHFDLLPPESDNQQKINLLQAAGTGRNMAGQKFSLVTALGMVVGVLILSTGAWSQDRARNPLSELFRSLDRGIRATGDELEREKTGRDQLDTRPIQRSEESRRLQQARDMVKQARWHEATELLQFLLDQPHDAFLFDSERQFQSLQAQADEILGQLPEDGMRNYLAQYAHIADKQFQQAMEEQDLNGLQHVAKVYFHTPAGRSALEVLARLWHDDAAFGQAATAWQRLATSASPEQKNHYLQLAARALAQAGRVEDAIELARSFDNEALEQELQHAVVGNRPTVNPSGPFQTLSGPLQTAEQLDPVLTPRWSQGLIERFAVQQQAQDLAEDLLDQGRVLLPTSHPLLIQGKIAVRTLRDLQVSDLATGRILWESRPDHSIEESVGKPVSENGDDYERHLYYRETLFENHPLTNVLYRDEIYGALSSDGARLYSVEMSGQVMMQTPAQIWERSEPDAAEVTPWSTNELVAYDLNTGHVQWRLGGARIEPMFSLPLAGTFFFGPPTPAGSELYVIGEQNNEVTLFCLSARTGELVWSQPLSMPGRPIGEDMVRRFWQCRPVIADGVILCPTTCGWLIAVDQTSGRLLWSSRFSTRVEPRREFRGGYSVQVMQEINRRWQNAIPLVQNGYVLFTPPEMPDEFGMTQPMIYCFDLQTGRSVWEHAKGERSNGTGLYLQGIWNDLAILVGTSSVVARRMNSTGSIAWSIPLPQPPAGRGLIINDRFLLPTTGQRLLQIHLASARLESSSQVLIEKGQNLGNLGFSQGFLVSQTPSRLMVFPAAPQTIASEGNAQQQTESRLSRARVLLASQKLDDAWQIISEIDTASLSPPLADDVNSLAWSLLQQRLKPNSSGAAEILAQLDRMALTPARRFEYERLLADYQAQSGNLEEALRHYLDHLAHVPPDTFVKEGNRTVRIDGWTGGRLHELYRSASPELQKQFDELLQQHASSLENELLTRNRWARALYFHPAGQKLELQLAQHEFDAGNPGSGLIRLQRVAAGSDASLAAQAELILARRLLALGWKEDAQAACARVESRPAITLPDGKESHEQARSTRQELQQQNTTSPAPSPAWSGTWQIERIGLPVDEAGTFSTSPEGPGLQALRQLRPLYHQESQRLRIEDRESGKFLTSFPLRGMTSFDFQPGLGTHLQGPLLLVVHRGALHSIDWADRRIQWTWSPDLRGSALNRLALTVPAMQPGMMPISQFIATRQFFGNRSQTGYLIASNERAVLLLCRDLIALDPLTGEELWRETLTAQRGIAHAIGLDLFAFTTRNERQLLNAVDGRSEKQKEISDRIQRAIAVLDHDLILLKRISRGNGVNAACELSRIQVDGTVIWKHDLPQTATLSLPDGESLVWLSVDENFSMIDFRTGQQHLLGKLSDIGSQPNSTKVFSDQNRIFVIADDADVQPTYLNLPGVRASGKIHAFNRQGSLLWSYDTPRLTPRDAPVKSRITPPSRHWPLNMPIQDFSENPLILLVGDRSDRSGEFFFHQLRVIGLEKATGKVVIDWERPSESGGFSFLHVDSDQQSIELRTYNERLRLRPRPANDNSLEPETRSAPDAPAEPKP